MATKTAKKPFVKHVKITLSCENCKNSSTHTLVPSAVSLRAKAYHAYHLKCVKPVAPKVPRVK